MMMRGAMPLGFGARPSPLAMFDPQSQGFGGAGMPASAIMQPVPLWDMAGSGEGGSPGTPSLFSGRQVGMMGGSPTMSGQPGAPQGGISASSAQHSVGPGGDVGPTPRMTDPSSPPNLLSENNDLSPPNTDVLTRPVDLSNVGVRHPKFLEHGGFGEKALKFLGEFGLQYSAGQGNPAAMLSLQNRAQQQHDQQIWNRQDSTRMQDHQWDEEAAAAKARLPDYFMSGKDRVAFDPVTNTTKVVYDGPSDAQDYADALGLNPGTPAYNTAVSDYVLRGNGSTALQNKTAFEGVKIDGRTTVESVRQRDRMQLRATPTYANMHPAPRRGMMGSGGNPPRSIQGVVAPLLSTIANGGTLTAPQQALVDDYRANRGGRGRGGGSSAPSGGSKVYQNAQGHRITWDGKAWVSAK